MKIPAGRWAMTLILGLGSAGCGTFMDLAGTNHHPQHQPPPLHPRVYGGVRADAGYVFCDPCDVEAGILAQTGDAQGPIVARNSETTRGGRALKGTAVLFLDLPVCFILDTLLLPISIPFEIFGPSQPAKPQAGRPERLPETRP